MIISISGKMCVGKDLLAAYYCSIIPLLTNNQLVGRQIAYADKLKTLTDINNIPEFIQDCYELGYINTTIQDIEAAIHYYHSKYVLVPGRKPREFLQHLGVALRNITPDIWIQHLELHLSRFDEGQVIWVISDARFSNELEFAQRNNMIKVYISTDEEVRRQRVRMFRGADQATEEIFNHISETELDNVPKDYFDILLDNSTSMQYFFDNSRKQLQTHLGVSVYHHT